MLKTRAKLKLKKKANLDAGKPAGQRTDAKSTEIRSEMRSLARQIQRATVDHVSDEAGWKVRLDQKRKAMRLAVDRGDTWENQITMLGVVGRDKRRGGRFVADRLVDLEAEDLWRGDDMAGRAIESVPNQIVRAGLEVHIQSMEPEADSTDKEKSGRIDWMRSPDGIRWWSDRIDALDQPAELKEKLKAKIRSDLASDVFPPASEAKAKETTKEVTEAVSAHLEELCFIDIVGEAIKTERGYGGSAIFPGVKDGQKDLSKPLDLRRIQSIEWLDVLQPLELIPFQWYDDPTAKNFGKPELYWMQRIAVGNTSSSKRIPIHESRLIVFPGLVVSRRQQREHWGWGDSILNRMMETLRDFQNAWQGTAVLLSDFSQAVMSIVGLAESFATGESTLLVDRARALDEGRSIARAAIIDAEEKFERQVTPLSGLADILDRWCNRLAASADTPVTVLMGQAPAGLNATGDSDIRNWYDGIDGVRQRKVKPLASRLLKMIFSAKQGPTKGKEPDKWTVKFGPLWQPTEKEIAETRYIVAQTDKIYIDALVLMPEEVAMSRYGGDTYSSETHLDEGVRAAFDQKAEEDAKAQAEQLQLESQAKIEAAKNGQPAPAAGPPGGKPAPKPEPKPAPAAP